MDPVAAQYEVYPYPTRDPQDERRRLVTGSPSALFEIDHFLFQGRRDWSRPFRALVAGGGTGDGLIQMAEGLRQAGCPAEVTYLDLSTAARQVAEARAAVRGLTGIRFLTGDLLGAPDLGRFDYIDCCGVLHHLPDPQVGFDALAAALSPEGGIGLMVYAPQGRTGVYPLQEAFATLLADDPVTEKTALARAALAELPETNWFRRNGFLTDHQTSDAGLYDLLLHARDRPFSVQDLGAALAGAGLGLVSLVEPLRYDPARMLPATPEFAARLARLDPLTRAGLGERLAGDIKLHVAYAAPQARAGSAEAKPGPDAVPRLNALAPRALAEAVARRGEIALEWSGVKHRLALPRSAAPLIALVGGRTLRDIAARAGRDWIGFAAAWAPVHAALTGVNRLHYSKVAG